MKWTKTPKTAMLRLADVLGWEVESTGRAWRVTNVSAADGLSYSALSLLCFMARIAIASPDIGGEGLTGPELTDLIRFRPKHNFSRQYGRYYLDCDGKIPATDESTMYAAFFNPEGEES